MNYRTFFIIAALSPLAIGNSSYASKKCQETELTGMQYIAQEEVPNFWVPVKKSTPIRFGRKIERAISNGRIGFVITNQTIDEEGNVSNVEIMESYPDDFFVEPALKISKSIKYKAVTCRHIPVRYQTIHTFINKKSDYKKLIKMYENSEKDS